MPPFGIPSDQLSAEHWDIINWQEMHLKKSARKGEKQGEQNKFGIV